MVYSNEQSAYSNEQNICRLLLVNLIYLLLITDMICRLPTFKKMKSCPHSFDMFLFSETI